VHYVYATVYTSFVVAACTKSWLNRTIYS